MPQRLRAEWAASSVGVVVAVTGWAVGRDLLAAVGVLVAFAGALLLVWQRHCLDGVRYTRRIGQQRLMFGEDLIVDLEVVNDKLLPLTWLHVSDEMPEGLELTGAPQSGEPGERRAVELVAPMLPYGRLRRSLTISCDRRGEHRFGPAQYRSGSPIRFDGPAVRLPDQTSVLVYPKVFTLSTPVLASRVPTGDRRARQSLVTDPSRVAGVRDYRAGDPMRHVDWRASARSRDLLVRVFEPATTLRVAVLADLRLPFTAQLDSRGDAIEYIVAVTASLVADLAGTGVPTGLATTAAVDGRPVVHPPSGAPGALAAMLEQLARCSAVNQFAFTEIVGVQLGRMQPGTSVVVISASFPASTLAALEALRRRAALTTVCVSLGDGRPSPVGVADTSWEVTYAPGWQQHETLELA